MTLTTSDQTEQDRLFKINLEKAIDKLDLGIVRRARMPPLTLDEMKALRQFYRQHG
ncbi:hypothetical protein [Bradyrhizobium sp. 141]|uniref:hypothetical protein n=1 Tax=Bradyrhizobium sp. 141 TaxID=2782617 RepID=UPI001FFA6980|nr:hypothetical protein [Bradyrhizobium sp. 141]MCK1718850.1 hypothetical protein [Bradyrhizobium sp. 141]